MADLSPLKFQIAIQDMATDEINKIEQKLSSLKDYTIKLKVDGNSGIQEALNVDDLVRQIQEAKRALSGNSFDTFDRHMKSAAESVNKLTENLNAFELAIKNDSGLKSYLAGLGAIVKNVRITMSGIGQGASGADASQSDLYLKNAKKLQDALFRIQEARAKVGVAIKDGELAGMNTNGMKAYLQLLDAYEKKLQNIRSNPFMMNEKGWQSQIFGPTFKHLLSNAGDFQRQVDGFVQKQQTVETNQRRFNTALDESERLLNRLESAGSKGFGLGLDTSKTERALRDIQQFIDKLLMFDSQKFGNAHAVNELIAEYRRLKSELTGVAREQERLNTTTEKSIRSVGAENTKKQIQKNAAWEESFRKAGVEATKLEITIRKLKDAERIGRDAKVDVSNLSAKIAELERYASILREIEGRSTSHGHTGAFMGRVGLDSAVRLANEEAGAVKKAATEKAAASRAASQLTAEQQRLAQAMNQTTTAAHGQSQVLGDLKSLATQYLGVWGAQQFLNNIIEIGGQLEMQRLSIGAILQNTSQANLLFDKIKGLAMQSPFGVVELDQMTKQLTAYGFKYNELFDMTKRLADISAATGTEVSRLALALGHVRAEGALSGYTLRQFSMGNIPLLEKLSEKLGKTKKEIREMSKKKEIGYEDVEDVIKGLTDEGGMFYNMQEVISQSVKAKFKNVKDAMSIMYGEMAEGSIGGALKGVAEALMKLTRNWKDVATVAGSMTAVWVTHRAAILLMNTALGQNTAAVATNMLSYKKKRAAELANEAMVRKLSIEEKALIATRKLITAENVRVAVSTGAMTKQDVLKLIALRKVSVEEAIALVRMGEFTAAEVRMALQGRVLGMNLGKLGAQIKLLGQRMSSAAAAMLSNPWMWAMAAISGIVELWQRNSREMEKAEELSKNIYEHSQEGLKNTRSMMDNTGIVAKWRENEKDEWKDVTSSYGAQIGGQYSFVVPEYDATDAKKAMDEWIQYLQDHAATPNRLLNHAFDTDNPEERYKRLAEAVKEVELAQKQLGSIDLAFENSVKESNGGWFDDDVMTDIKDYDDTLKEFDATIAKTYNDYRRGIDSGIIAARKQSKSFNEQVKNMATLGQQFAFLIKNQSKFPDAMSAFFKANKDAKAAFENTGGFTYKDTWESLFGSNDKWSDLLVQKVKMEEELGEFYIQLEAELETKGIKIGSMSEAQQQALLLGYKEKLQSIEGLTDETYKYLMEKFAERFSIKLDVDEERWKADLKKLADWQKRAQKIFELNQEIKIKTTTSTSMDEFVKAVQEDLEKKKKYISDHATHISQLIKISPKLQMDAAYLKRYIDALSAEAIKLAIKSPQAFETLNSLIQDELMPYYRAIKSVEEDKKYLESEGYPESSKTKKDKKTGDNGSKAWKDVEVEKWKERLKNIKKAHKEYEDWVKDHISEEEALEKVKENFKGLLSDEDLNNIKDFKKVVEDIEKKATARYESQKGDKSKNNGKAAQDLAREAKDELNDIVRSDFARSSERWSSDMKNRLDELTRKWELFNEVRSATGSKSVAAGVTGLGADADYLRNSADAAREEIENEWTLMRNAVKMPLEFDVNMTDKQIEDMVSKALSGTEYEERIAGIIEMLKKWRDLQRNATTADIKGYAKLIGSAVDYKSQVQKINDELDKQKESNKKLVESGEISQKDADKANSIAEAQAEDKIWKQSLQYVTLMNTSLALTGKEVRNGINAAMRHLNALLKENLITAKDYADEMENLRKIQDDWKGNALFGKNNATTSFMKGGLNGLVKYYETLVKDAETRKSSTESTSQEKADAEKQLEDYAEILKKLKNIRGALSGVALVSEALMGAFEGLQNASKSLSEMFDALGNEGAANFWSDVSESIGGISSIFAPVSNMLQQAMSGDVGGILSSAISAPVSMITGPITAFSKLHDNRIERAINKLREDVKIIENNTALILKARERALGYDTGELQRSYAQQYAPSQKQKAAFANDPILGRTYFGQGFSSMAQRDMYEYYEKSTEGTGYQQEYQNLLKQREDYIDILDKQESKKKKSQSDIDETIAKIGELDDKIRFFSQDLAKELWSIDIKGWADQLSDALASAFENGENMAKAYEDTVTNILQSVFNKMLKLKVIEPMLASLENKLFGENGAFDPNDPKGSMDRVTAALGEYFGKGGDGEKAITAVTQMATAFEQALKPYGLSMKSDSGKTLSASIQGASEETNDLLAGYVNALRQDVSVNRLLLTQFVAEMWPSYFESFVNHTKVVSNIDNNVQVVMEMMRDGRGAMYDEIHSLRSRIDNVVTGIESFTMR